MFASYLADLRNTLARLDRNQITTMLGYLTCCRDRRDHLYIDAPESLPIILGFARADITSRRYYLDGSQGNRGDCLLTIPGTNGAPPLTQDLTYLAIVGADGGDTARHAAACVIIPSFQRPVVEACEQIVWRGLTHALGAQ